MKITNISRYFQVNNFMESMALQYAYDSQQQTVTLICAYAWDVVLALMAGSKPPLRYNGELYHRDLRKLVFTNVTTYTSLASAYKGLIEHKDNFQDKDQQATVSVDYLKCKSLRRSNYFGADLALVRWGSYRFKFHQLYVSRKLLRSAGKTPGSEEWAYSDIETGLPVDFYHPFFGMNLLQEIAMAAQPDPFYTPEEYIALEREAEYKSEYIDGVIIAMTGASREHNLIATNISRRLGNQLEGKPCEVYASDMRVKAGKGKAYTYPDVVVVCGEPQFEDKEVDTLLNPSVLVEVLSPSTEGYDRGKKFEKYRALPSLQEYLLIAQDNIQVEHYVRQGEKWILSAITRIGDTVDLPSIECSLAINEIYDKVSF